MARAYTEKRKQSNAKWDAENLKRTSIAIPLEQYERLKAHTTKTGESINGFIRAAIDEKLESDS